MTRSAVVDAVWLGRAWIAVLLLTVAGCSGPTPEPTPSVPALVPRAHALLNVTEPTDFVAPAFTVLEPLAKIRGGEPSVWADARGQIWVTFPGCENGTTSCANGPLYRTSNDGVNWSRVNQAENGALDPRGAGVANGDADVATDSDGNVFVTHLGQDGVHFYRSLDEGENWRHLGTISSGSGSDRQWMAAAGPRTVVVAWMQTVSENRVLQLLTTHDGGESFSGKATFGSNLGWLGSPQFAPDGRRVYVPFTEAAEPIPGPAGVFASPTVALKVARSENAGDTWIIVDTKVRLARVFTGLHWSGLLMAPTLDVTADGTVVFLWSMDVPGATQATSAGSRIEFIASQDQGATWSTPLTVPTRPSAVLPWVVGGGGDRFAVSYYASDATTTPDEAENAVWDTMLTVVDGAGASSPRFETVTIEKSIHRGKLCVRGGTCGTTQSDRSLLDFFENDVLPDGRIVVVYIRDEGSDTELQVKVAIQSGGSRLFTTSSG